MAAASGSATTPRLSVIVPTRNRKGTVARAVTSVLQNKRPDIELIVVDDGSADGSVEYLSGVGDPRLRWQSVASRGNANRARNLGAQMAQGCLLAFLDSDDAFGPDRADRLIAFFSDRLDVDCLLDGFVDISRTRQTVHRLPGLTPPGPEIRRMLLEHLLPLTNSAITVRRAAFEAIGGYDEGMPRHQDRELLLRLATDHTICFGHATDIRKYRTRDSVSHDFDGYIAGFDALAARCPEYLRPEYAETFRYLIVRGIVKAFVTGHPAAAFRELMAWRSAKNLPKDFLHSLASYRAGHRRRLKARHTAGADPKPAKRRDPSPATGDG